MPNDYTVLNDWAGSGESSHQEDRRAAAPEAEREMPEERYEVDFTADLQRAVIDAITRDLSANLAGEDWIGMGFDDPEDFLDAEAVSEAIADQLSGTSKTIRPANRGTSCKSFFEYAEEYDLVELSSVAVSE